jgi:hypothetical protein
LHLRILPSTECAKAYLHFLFEIFSIFHELLFGCNSSLESYFTGGYCG